jgi:hypothetical protein
VKKREKRRDPYIFTSSLYLSDYVCVCVLNGCAIVPMLACNLPLFRSFFTSSLFSLSHYTLTLTHQQKTTVCSNPRTRTHKKSSCLFCSASDSFHRILCRQATTTVHHLPKLARQAESKNWNLAKDKFSIGP